MGRKKKNTVELDEENTSDNKVESLGAFPKITLKCSIKQVVFKKNNQDIRFERIAISDGPAELLSGLARTGEEINLTISAVQGQLQGM